MCACVAVMFPKDGSPVYLIYPFISECRFFDSGRPTLQSVCIIKNPLQYTAIFPLYKLKISSKHYLKLTYLLKTWSVGTR